MICGDDAAQPRSEWQQWRRIAAPIDARAHLSVKTGAYVIDCNTPHRRKELAAGVPRQRSTLGLGTRGAMCQSDVQQCHFATAIQERSAGRGYPSPSPET